MAVSWRFDGDDLLSGVGGHWNEFALANNGGGCVPPPLGRHLADFVSGTDLCVVWKAVLGLARRERDHPLTLTYRCDAPTERRLMKATITANAGHEVDIISSVELLRPRPAMPLLDAATANRSDEMIRMCGWCARFQVDGWVDVEVACRRLHLLELESTPLPHITHGICGDCKEALIQGLDLPFDLQSAGRHR
jgi:hypothetical protein